MLELQSQPLLPEDNRQQPSGEAFQVMREASFEELVALGHGPTAAETQLVVPFGAKMAIEVPVAHGDHQGTRHHLTDWKKDVGHDDETF